MLPQVALMAIMVTFHVTSATDVCSTTPLSECTTVSGCAVCSHNITDPTLPARCYNTTLDTCCGAPTCIYPSLCSIQNKTKCCASTYMCLAQSPSCCPEGTNCCSGMRMTACCNKTQTCCGTSQFALCCNEGSTCCAQYSFARCCPPGTTCKGIGCIPNGEVFQSLEVHDHKGQNLFP
eukprot:PhF_6_TR6232/c0_g1_i4/m.9420